MCGVCVPSLDYIIHCQYIMKRGLIHTVWQVVTKGYKGHAACWSTDTRLRVKCEIFVYKNTKVFETRYVLLSACCLALNSSLWNAWGKWGSVCMEGKRGGFKKQSEELFKTSECQVWWSTAFLNTWRANLIRNMLPSVSFYQDPHSVSDLCCIIQEILLT